MTATPLFSLKNNPAEGDSCPCQRHPGSRNACEGTGALLLSELRIKDGPHVDMVYLPEGNPWAIHDLQEFNDVAYAEHSSYAVGFVEMVGNHGPRQMDLEE